MTRLSTVELVAGVLSFVLVLAWASLARAAWWRVRARRGTAAFALLGALLTSALTLIYFSSTIFAVVPVDMHYRPNSVLGALYVVNDTACLLAVVIFRHWTRFFAVRRTPASRRWLATNYGSAVAAIALAVAVRTVTPPREHPLVFAGFQIGLWTYMLVMLGLSMRQVAALARGPRWRPGSTSVARRPDVLVLGVGVACVLLMVVLHASGSWAVHRDLLNALPIVLGVAILLPFAVRSLGGLLASIGTNVATLAAAGAVLYGVWALDRSLADPALRPLELVLAAAGLVVAFGPVQRAVAVGLDWLVLRRRRDRWLCLQRFLRELSPELGGAECARRAVERIADGMHLRGAAFVSRDGEAVCAGGVAIEPVVAVWPRGSAADALVARAAIHDDLAVLAPELREALIDADVVGVIPVRGARRLWGHLLLATDLVGTSFFEDELQSIEAYADQLARILDAADMLARVVAVERSLAHAEKLAAIGELAARIAHEIRNPVTAARSLAQTLSRDPTSPLNAEHAELILAELQRVERQVAALLRFARREDLTFAPTDLGELLRETAAHFEPRFAGHGIACAVDAPRGVVARVDREKIRQVLINLVENAIDALAEHDVPQRSVALSLAQRNGCTALEVADNGPGIPADALERVFDPFFSRKPQGTGLGLAIVKRTVEAHGGRVRVEPLVAGGTRFEIELPVAPPLGAGS
ncbi:MAG: HAMP domain-containing sensor histidine kinase [Thermodesulfobacteriota bacterium]